MLSSFILRDLEAIFLWYVAVKFSVWRIFCWCGFLSYMTWKRFPCSILRWCSFVCHMTWNWLFCRILQWCDFASHTSRDMEASLLHSLFDDAILYLTWLGSDFSCSTWPLTDVLPHSLIIQFVYLAWLRSGFSCSTWPLSDFFDAIFYRTWHFCKCFVICLHWTIFYLASHGSAFLRHLIVMPHSFVMPFVIWRD